MNIPHAMPVFHGHRSWYDVGPYLKSLLYLVSRALEIDHKTPLLGLANSLDPNSIAQDIWSPQGKGEVRDWISFWDGHASGKANKVVLESRKVSNGVDEIAASHGCFDNAVGILSDTLNFAAQPTKKVRIQRLDY